MKRDKRLIQPTGHSNPSPLPLIYALRHEMGKKSRQKNTQEEGNEEKRKRAWKIKMRIMDKRRKQRRK